jgi:hypothetical protein
MYPEERAVNGYGDVMTADKPASMRDEIRGLHQLLALADKREAELAHRLEQLSDRVGRIERTIGE